MVVFPNAKINLGLSIVARRPDGFHDIETLFYPVAFRDILEIIPAGVDVGGFTATGLPIPGTITGNLCIRAFDLLAKDFPIPPVRIHLHKIIPMGAGLGGGSSDAAYTILLLNSLFSLGLSGEKMKQYAGKLGSDCPFFILNKPSFAYGRGDLLETANVDLKGLSILLVIPGIHVSTAEAYAGVSPKRPYEPLRNVLSRPPEDWKSSLFNDFEPSVFRKFPALGRLRDDLYGAGAVYASLTGSGSAVYGLFRGSVPGADLFPGCTTWSALL